jgi:F-type H+-transporting ATPase subunit a
MKVWKLVILLIINGLCTFALAQEGAHNPEQHPAGQPERTVNQAPGEHTMPETGHPAGDSHDPCAAHEHEEEPFDAGSNAVEHIADANAIHVFGDIFIHLPVILKDKTAGWKFLGSTANFEVTPHSHGSGAKAIDRFVLYKGAIERVRDDRFPTGEVAIGNMYSTESEVAGKIKYQDFVCFNGETFPLDKKSTLDGGVMGGGMTSFMDFSITKNVFTMLLTVLGLFFAFTTAARAYKKREGQAPKGLQGFLEPLILFIQEDVCKPSIGPNYMKYVPYLLSAFFFILGLNLIGQIPFFPGGANVTGNISITIVLAIITFLITNFSGNKHYWEHIVWMPGVPAVLKIFLITPIEILGIFLKPITLLLRLFANISAGHIVILSFVSLIFILGKAGASVGGSVGGMVMSVPLTLFMSALELLVAFLQAYIFVMLSATYIGSAIEEHHH